MKPNILNGEFIFTRSKMNIQEKIIIYERRYIWHKANHRYVRALWYYILFKHLDNKH